MRYRIGLQRPLFDWTAEQAVRPTMSRSSARSTSVSPGRERGGSTASRPSGPTSTRMNALAPGFIVTPMTDAIPEHVREKAVAAIPLGRVARPEEVAAVTLFFAGDESSYVTGQTLLIDGGRSVGRGLA